MGNVESTEVNQLGLGRSLLDGVSASSTTSARNIFTLITSYPGEISEPPLSWFEPLAFDSRRSLLLLFAERGNDHCADHAAPLVIGFYFSSGARSFRKETYKSKS
jgi:hypothetical protein